MNEALPYWVWLSQLKGVGCTTQRRLLRHFGTPQKVFNAEAHDLMDVPGMNRNRVTALLGQQTLSLTYATLKACSDLGLSIIPWDDQWYPKEARDTPSIPIVLYATGLIPPQKAVALFGDTVYSHSGRRTVVDATAFLSMDDTPLITSMEEGISRLALQTVRDMGGRFIALAVGGADCQPPPAGRMAEELGPYGTIVYLHPPGISVQRHHFLERNALLAAWATTGLVPEVSASKRVSGPAQAFLERQRPLFVAPHPEDSWFDIWQEIAGTDDDDTTPPDQLPDNEIAAGVWRYRGPEQLAPGIGLEFAWEADMHESNEEPSVDNFPGTLTAKETRPPYISRMHPSNLQ